MTSEYLLDAFGLIDDDLIVDGESACVRPYKSARKQFLLWLPAAACVALLLVTVPTLGRGGTESACAPSASDSAPSDAASEKTELSQDTAGSISQSGADSSNSTEAILFTVTVDGMEYGFTPSYDVPLLDTLPEDCRHLGQVEPYSSGGDGEEFYTLFNTVYSGCQMWLVGEENDLTLYLELPEGGYLLCRQR